MSLAERKLSKREKSLCNVFPHEKYGFLQMGRLGREKVQVHAAESRSDSHQFLTKAIRA